MDGDDKLKIDEQFSLLDARARKRRRSSVVLTLALVAVTAMLVLRLAGDIVDKQAQVTRVEQSRGELDQQLRSEQEKLDAAIRIREKLEAEVKELEATKKGYQQRILSEKEAHNTGGSQGTGYDKPLPASAPSAESRVDPDAVGAAPLLIEEAGKAPQGFVLTPNITVTPGRGTSGREIFKVQLSLDLPEAHRGNVERVVYHLSPKYYMRNTIEGGSAPPFEANFNVFACESTVLARVKLRDGTTLAVDFDWCRHEGWPDRKKQPVIIASEDEKVPAPAPVPVTKPPRTAPSNYANPR